MSNHTWIRENLAAYLAGGLTADERDRFEEHTADCVACSQALAAARNLDEAMTDLFMDARPDAGLEERMVTQLQRTPPRRRDWPLWLRFVSGAAAAVLFGVVGAALHLFAADSPVRWLAEARPETQSANNLKQIGVHPFQVQMAERSALSLHDHDDSRSMQKESLTRSTNGSAISSWAWFEGKDVDMNSSRERIPGITLPGSINPNEAVGVLNGDMSPAGSTPGSSERNLHLEIKNSPFQFEAKPSPQTYQFSLGINREGEGRAIEKDSKAGAATEYYGFNQPTLAPVMSPPPAVPIMVPSPPQRVLVMQPKEAAPEKTGQTGLDKQPPTEKQPEPRAPAAASERKIIRSGDMEFEIEKYDAAAGVIGKLTEGIKGAYIESDDSRVQPNGKKRGVIVVRVAPTGLGKFIADLRTELGKLGELKSQRIGSQDITKQYIDTESNLKVARAMEQRFLDIIKSGKGEIKDLIAAENALGEWRSKIERMEGEKRYFDKQVSLGTLTLTLYEKEIQAPSAIVVTEKVGMKIEVEDVEKAQQAALAAAAEVKGRVTKSELKQYAQGHLKATIQVEVAPAAAHDLGEKLKKLGILTHHDAQRLQEARGDSGRPSDLKPTVSDVVFEIELYNAANIRPREAFKLTIATLDVPASYRKLQDVVARVKGQVREGKLNELDKLNVTAQFDFDVLTSDKPAIDKVLAEVGPQVARSIEQAPANELATDRKVGYRLVLRNVAGSPPREKVALTVEVAQVEARTNEIKRLVEAAKGIVIDSRLRHETSGTVVSSLVFDVPLTANEALVQQIKRSGTVRSQQAVTNPQVPENELATARLEVALTNGNLIVPADAGFGTQIRRGLSISFQFFSWALIFIITGVLVLVPCAFGVMLLTRFVMWLWRRSAAKAPA